MLQEVVYPGFYGDAAAHPREPGRPPRGRPAPGPREALGPDREGAHAGRPFRRGRARARSRDRASRDAARDRRHGRRRRARRVRRRSRRDRLRRDHPGVSRRHGRLHVPHRPRPARGRRAAHPAHDDRVRPPRDGRRHPPRRAHRALVLHRPRHRHRHRRDDGHREQREALPGRHARRALVPEERARRAHPRDEAPPDGRGRRRDLRGSDDPRRRDGRRARVRDRRQRVAHGVGSARDARHAPGRPAETRAARRGRSRPPRDDLGRGRPRRRPRRLLRGDGARAPRPLRPPPRPRPGAALQDRRVAAPVEHADLRGARAAREDRRRGLPEEVRRLLHERADGRHAAGGLPQGLGRLEALRVAGEAEGLRRPPRGPRGRVRRRRCAAASTVEDVLFDGARATGVRIAGPGGPEESRREGRRGRDRPGRLPRLAPEDPPPGHEPPQGRALRALHGRLARRGRPSRRHPAARSCRTSGTG